MIPEEQKQSELGQVLIMQPTDDESGDEELTDEDAINELIGVIWPLIDKGRSKEDVSCLIQNVMDSWEPAN